MNTYDLLSLPAAIRNTDHLTTALAEYGLCPSEWRVINEGRKTYTIKNIHEPSFYFRGITKFVNGRRKWQSISLAGL